MTELERPKPQQKRTKDRDPRLDDELAETFPASDPPSMTQPSVKIGAPDHQRRKAK